MDKATAKQMYEFVKQLVELNKDVEFRTISRLDNDILAGKKFYASVPSSDLKLPEGFHIDAFGKITNRNPKAMFDDKYIEFEFGMINKIKDQKTNNIEEVNNELYTAEELALLNNKEEQEKKAEEIKKDDSLSFDSSLDSDTKLEKKIINKELHAKIKGFLNIAKNKLIYTFSKGTKFKEENKKEEKKDDRGYYQGKKWDNKTIIENLKSLYAKIEKNNYVTKLHSKEVTPEKAAEYVNKPEEYVEKLKDYALIAELHTFASMDKNYDEAEFEKLSKMATSLRTTEQFQINRLLQEIRYTGAKEAGADFTRYGGFDNNQMEFLKNRLTVIYDKANNSFLKDKNELYNQLHDYEKAFIDDAHAEGLSAGDPEYTQMLKERAVDENKIKEYYAKIEELKNKYGVKEEKWISKPKEEIKKEEAKVEPIPEAPDLKDVEKMSDEEIKEVSKAASNVKGQFSSSSADPRFQEMKERLERIKKSAEALHDYNVSDLESGGRSL